MDNKWNVCSKLDQQEKDIIDKELYLKSLYNTQKFWLKKNCSLVITLINTAKHL